MFEMPKKAHKHDKAWVRDQLQELADLTSYQAASFASIKYDEVFDIVWSSNIGEIERENKARREANTRLRKYVEAMNNKYRRV